jgi:multidrug efflux pump subunit AcrB
MNIAEASIKNRVVTLTFAVVMLVGGIQAFNGLSRLEDPEFTIKDALVITPYPGASAAEVEEEVTDHIEIAVQQLGQLDEIESRSTRGMSNLTVSIKKQYDKNSLPQVWDELRRKVGDAQSGLPPGAGPSLVVDDFGDVYGVFVAVYGEEYSYAELKDVIDLLRRELLLVQDVAKIDTYGEFVEAIYVELERDRMAELGIPTDAIIRELKNKNIATSAGRVKVGPEFISIVPTGELDSVEDFESVLISPGESRQIFLRDVARVWRGYVEPPENLMRYDGKAAIGLGISTVSGGNVVTMGEALGKRMDELLPQLPLGIDLGLVSIQSQAVTEAISGFVVSLIQAVVIVIAVLLVFMGLRSGLLIGFVLVLTIAGTFIFMGPWGVALERISLGALIIALGMLVDNAIVVVDGMLIRIQKGEDPEAAAAAVVNQTSMPLLGATIVAILAFAAIGTSDDSTGEFCRSLFQVVYFSRPELDHSSHRDPPARRDVLEAAAQFERRRRSVRQRVLPRLPGVLAQLHSRALGHRRRSRRRILRLSLGLRLRRSEFLPALDAPAVHDRSLDAHGNPHRRYDARRRESGGIPPPTRGRRARQRARGTGCPSLHPHLHTRKAG